MLSHFFIGHKSHFDSVHVTVHFSPHNREENFYHGATNIFFLCSLLMNIQARRKVHNLLIFFLCILFRSIFAGNKRRVKVSYSPVLNLLGLSQIFVLKKKKKKPFVQFFLYTPMWFLHPKNRCRIDKLFLAITSFFPFLCIASSPELVTELHFWHYFCNLLFLLQGRSLMHQPPFFANGSFSLFFFLFFSFLFFSFFFVCFLVCFLFFWGMPKLKPPLFFCFSRIWALFCFFLFVKNRKTKNLIGIKDK